MNPARAIRTNDTRPPPETSLCFTQGVQYVADLMLPKTVEAPDWTKLASYLPPGRVACAANRAITDATMNRLLTNFEFPSTRRPPLMEARVQADAVKNIIILIEEARKTTEASLISVVYENMQAHIENADFLMVSFHGTHVPPDLLEGYERYQAQNWDQFDAEPITAETLAYARRLMRIMPTSLGAPDVAPAADGSITLEWVPDDITHKLDKLFLDIGPGEEWRAYWKMRNGKFDRLLGHGFPADCKRTLKNLFDNLSA